MATKASMNDVLLTFMQDAYYAERQILKALPKLAKASESEDLKNDAPSGGNAGPGGTSSTGVRRPLQAGRGACAVVLTMNPQVARANGWISNAVSARWPLPAERAAARNGFSAA
jgi:Domain of unknown function (DUF892)